MSINDIKQAISRGNFTTTELQGIINYSRTVMETQTKATISEGDKGVVSDPHDLPSSEDGDDDFEDQEGETNKDEAKYLSSSESGEETILQVFDLLSTNGDHLTSAALEGSPGVGVNSNSHPYVSCED